MVAWRYEISPSVLNYSSILEEKFVSPRGHVVSSITQQAEDWPVGFLQRVVELRTTKHTCITR